VLPQLSRRSPPRAWRRILQFKVSVPSNILHRQAPIMPDGKKMDDSLRQKSGTGFLKVQSRCDTPAVSKLSIVDTGRFGCRSVHQSFQPPLKWLARPGSNIP
jgi:hypothetical protein